MTSKTFQSIFYGFLCKFVVFENLALRNKSCLSACDGGLQAELRKNEFFLFFFYIYSYLRGLDLIKPKTNDAARC